MRVLLLIIVTFLALPPLSTLAHGGTEVSVGGEVRANGPIEIVGEAFEANDHVRLELRKESMEPIALGTVAADAEGAFTVTLHLPASVRPGIYQLAAEGEESATADVTVLPPADGGAPLEPEPSSSGSLSNDRGPGEVIGLATFTGIIALVAVGLLWWGRTRPRPAAG